jgi:hypothetical protein
MSAIATKPAVKQWPADLLAFADEYEIRAYLDPLWETTWRVFPTARKLTVFQEDDPELRDDRYVVFEVRVPQQDVPDFVEAKHNWNREFFRVCPAPLSHLIRLTLLVVSG